MNSRRLFISLCSILVFLLPFFGISCNSPTTSSQNQTQGSAQSQEIANAKNTAQSYYESIKAHDFVKAATLCTVEINGTQFDVAQHLLNDDYPREGELQSYKYDSWKLYDDNNHIADNTHIATQLALVYKLTYSKAKTLEYLFFRESTGAEVKITGIGDTTQYNDEQWPAKDKFNW